MKSQPSFASFTRLFLVATAVTTAILLMTANASAYSETVLYSLTGGTDGAFPRGGVTFDALGNLYGTSQYANQNGTCCGSVWRLSPSGNTWTATVLHTFKGGIDGATPYAGVVVDAGGNVFGTASAGGNLHACNGGCGVVFEISPKQGGGLTYTVIHAFSGGKDGANPWAGLTMDIAGNLYGTTAGGGAYGNGVVFRLTPKPGGVWGTVVIHAFTGGADGATPFGTLTLDAAGNIYGTAMGGGDPACAYVSNGCGTVFELIPLPGGGWSGKLLHLFHLAYGGNPQGGVVFDTTGNLYGTIAFGGEPNGCDGWGCGGVYELSPTQSGQWTFNVLHEFTDTNSDGGFYPAGNLLLDGAGNVYGTASSGGLCGDGLVYELSPSPKGPWPGQLVHSFACQNDGRSPLAGLISDAQGNMYGTTAVGGSHGYGAVYKIVP